MSTASKYNANGLMAIEYRTNTHTHTCTHTHTRTHTTGAIHTHTKYSNKRGLIAETAAS